MSVIAFFSAKGAPGTTTTAMLTASVWPRPALLADCDPAGGDIALRLPAPDGRPLDPATGMLSLLPIARRAIEPGVLAEHAQQVLGGGEVLAGLSGPEQALAVGPLWSTIASAFGRLDDHDVIVDVGRLDTRSPVLPLVVSAALAICVVDNQLSSVYSSRARLRSLVPALHGTDGGGPRIGVVVRSTDRRGAQDAGQVIEGEFENIAYLGHLAQDTTGAGIFDGHGVSRPERTMLVRSGVEVVDAIQMELRRLTGSRGAGPEPRWDFAPGAGAPNDPGPTGPPGVVQSAGRRRFGRARKAGI